MKAATAAAAILGLGAVLFGTGGCSREGATLLPTPFDDASWPTTLPSPPEETERAAWRAVGVSLAPLAPEIGFETWIRGGQAEGAARGTAEGLLTGIRAVVSSGAGGGSWPIFVGMTVVFAPVGAVLGGVAGAATAVPQETAEEIDTFVRSTFDGESFGAELRDRLVRRAGEETSFAVTAVDSEQDMDDGAVCAADTRLTTLLQLSVTGYGFFGGGGEDPSLSVVLAVQGRIIDAATCGEADGDGTLQAEIDRGTETLAETLVEELFLLYLPKEVRSETGHAVADRGRAAATPWA
jgi:hypothetical protein